MKNSIPRKLKCPNCGYNIPGPTQKQLRAYFLVHVMGHSHQEAAGIMNISRPTLTVHLKKLKAIRPDLMPKQTEKVALRKIIIRSNFNTCNIKHQF